MPANTGKFLPVSVFGVPNTGIPVSVYTGLETLDGLGRRSFEKKIKKVHKKVPKKFQKKFKKRSNKSSTKRFK
jgi:hypothetical protein